MRAKLLVLALFSLAAFGQSGKPVPKRIDFSVEPKALKIRPLSTAVVQVKVIGEVTGADGNAKEGRLRENGWSLEVSPGNGDGGWISKPFRFQGTDSDTFVDSASDNMLGSLFRNLAGQFTIKDTVVYNAPAKPGKYKLEAKVGSVTGAVEIEVANDAPADEAAKPQKWTFGPEPAIADPYRKLAEHYAPYVAQETWFDWRADALCRTDFDNDWDTGNNWENLGAGSTQAYVYYAAMESQTHWFLIYNFFHARDYSDNCVAGTCHENDNEGAIFAIRKDGSEFGKLETIETLAHNNVYSYTNDRDLKKGAHDIEGRIVFHDNTHPVVFLEAGGHGALGGADSKALFDPEGKKWRKNTGITYFYKGIAERPKHAMDREVGYELLPIYHHWWARATKQSSALAKMFSAFYSYAPYGNRPRMKHSDIAGSFLGIKHGRDKAKPFWGWHDAATQRKKILATGQWAADPAYSLSRNLTFPPSKPISLDYVFNPYLDVPGPQPPFVEVVRNAKEGELDVASIPAIPGTATQQEVATQPPPSTPAPTASALVPGSCELEVKVDGTVEVQLERDQVKYEVKAGAPQQQKSFSCTTPLPADAANLNFRVEKKSGRGSVKLTDARTGRVEIADPSRGAGDYRVVLHWTPQ